MSPRAAWRLESLGFDQVYDYVAGKDDWLSHGLPVAGESVQEPQVTAGDAARADVPTCRYDDRLAQLDAAVLAQERVECVVLNDAGIVLGRLPEKALAHDGDTPVDQVMEPGPTTIRPGTTLEEIVERMEDARVDRVLVTNAEGKFVGVLYLEDAKQRLAESSHLHA